MATSIPVVPTFKAGQVATSSGLNGLVQAASFLVGSGTGATPQWILQNTAGGTVAANATASVPWNAEVKDNDGVWSSGANTVVTIQTPGIYTVDWFVACTGAAASQLTAWVQVQTTASNPSNPSSSITVQYCSIAANTTGSRIVSGGGLAPVWLNTGDTLAVRVQSDPSVATTYQTGSQQSSFSGMWVGQ